MNGNGLQAVIFDMDGVLVDSEQYWECFLKENLIPKVTRNGEKFEFNKLQGRNMEEIYGILDKKHELNISEDYFYNIYNNQAKKIYKNKTELMNNFSQIESRITENNLSIALATSSPMDWVQMVQSRFKLENTFDVIVSGGDDKLDSKPSPDIYIEVLDRLEAIPENCVAIEDTPSGVRSATAAGIYCIGFDKSGKNQLTEADEIVNSDIELQNLLFNLI